ncbi:MAG TPA: CGNR zinc finger domain-containing protein [Thermoleophilaceae bacterium]
MENAVNVNAETNEQRAFIAISGHRALDLLATLRDRHRDPIECLRDPADLDRWLKAVGLPLGASARASDVQDARRLREAINDLTRAVLAQRSPPAGAVRELNEWARRSALAPQTDSALTLEWAADEPVHGALALVAREAVELLTGPERALIRECAAAPECSRVYLDRSRSGRRRWCHMDWCGSRAKMASYRQRQRQREAQPAT